MTERFADYDEFFYKAFVDKDGKGQRSFDYQRRLALDDATRLRRVPECEEVVIEVEFDSWQARHCERSE